MEQHTAEDATQSHHNSRNIPDTDKTGQMDSSDQVGALDPSTPQKKSPEEKSEDEPKEFKRSITGVRWFSVCVGLYLTALLYGLDTTIAADVQGPILDTFGEIEKLSWVGIGFPMGSVVSILILGSCYGKFEIKWIYLGSLIVFEIGSAICGAAPSMNSLIVGRVVAGMGGAGIYLGCLTYIAVFTSLRERPIYNALIGLVWGAGCILGPVVGGALSVSKATWRWAFYINLVLAAITAPCYIFWFPRFNPQPQLSARSKVRQLDWVGAFLNASTFVLFMVTLSLSGAVWRWQSGRIIGLWVAFGISVVAYAIQQTFSIFTTEEHRVFPVQLLKRRSMLLMYFGTSAAASSLFVPVYYVPLFFQFTKGDSAIQAAVRLLPFITVTITFAMVSGAFLPKFGRYMPFYFPAGMTVLVGGILMFLVTPETHTGAIYGFEVLIATGAGLTQQMGYSVAATKAKPHEITAAIGLINVAQLGSTAIALAISGNMFQNIGLRFLKEALREYNFSETDLQLALSGAQSIILAQGDDKVRSLAIGAIVRTISTVYGLVIAAGCLTLTSAIFMSSEKLVLS